jgi:hypothetical protein
MVVVHGASAQESGTLPADDPVVVVVDPGPTEPVPLTGPQSVPQNRIASDFRPMLGNDAEAVVHALRTGSDITLTETTPGALPGDPPVVETVTIDSPTGPLGNGEVRHTLDLAKFQLAQAGISEPTASELQAALTGGAVTNADGATTDMQGILAMRADGMGWGKIAQEMGTTLGAIKNGTAVATPPAPLGGGTPVTDEGAPAPAADDTTTASRSGTGTLHGKGQGIVDAGGESVATATSATQHGKSHDTITDALGGSSAGHGRADTHISNGLGESGAGRDHHIVDGLGSGGADHGGKQTIVNAMGDSGASHGRGANIVDGLGGVGGGGGGRGANVTDALGSDGGLGGSHGGGNGGGGGHGGGHGHH